jgi:hypothetical protein
MIITACRSTCRAYLLCLPYLLEFVNTIWKFGFAFFSKKISYVSDVTNLLYIMLHKYLATCFDHINDTNILKIVQHNGMSKINFFQQTCLSKPGPIRLLFDADKFGQK